MPLRPPKCITAAVFSAAFLTLVSAAPAVAAGQGDRSTATAALVNSFSRGYFAEQHYWGLVGSLSTNLSPRFGLVVEASGQDRDATNSVYTLIGGPRFGRIHGSVRPYVQLPAGLVHTRTRYQTGPYQSESHTTGFVLQPGGGVDVRLNDSLRLRVGADYFVATPRYLESWRFYTMRVVTGLTVKM